MLEGEGRRKELLIRGGGAWMERKKTIEDGAVNHHGQEHTHQTCSLLSMGVASTAIVVTPKYKDFEDNEKIRKVVQRAQIK